MPLITLCGAPASGKTTRAYELKDYFERKQQKMVYIISEDEAIAKMGFEKNEAYTDPKKEKCVRSYLKSEVVRLLNKDNIVILDGPNYIKGYRYELHCAAKAVSATHCLIYTIRNHEESWMYNQNRDIMSEITVRGNKVDCDPCNHVPFNKEVFKALTFDRFEEPNPSNRWDSPLFSVQPISRLEMHEIYASLYELKPPPPNMCTRNPPLSSTNFLYDIDRITQSISKVILDSKRLNIDALTFPEYPGCVLEPQFMMSVNPQKLLRLRRQFLSFVKSKHSDEDVDKIGRHYILYLNKTLVE